MAGSQTEPTLSFEHAEAFEAWLGDHHADTRSAWLKIAKKGAPEPTLTYDQAVEVALCFGWVDGRKAALDESYWLQRFTPRTKRSRWSKINREKAERLIAEGAMRPAGLDAVEQARADGRWEAAYAGSRTATVPEDLKRQLALHPAAAAGFERLDARNRYAILWRIGDAKRPETRTRRIAKYVEMLERGERLHP